jgi:uncharacterized membrane protein
MPADEGRAGYVERHGARPLVERHSARHLLDKAARALGALLLVAYPACVYFALGRVSVRPLSIGLAIVMAMSLFLRMQGRRREHALVMVRIPLSVGALLLLGAWSDDQRFVLALPVLTNGVLFAQFASSLRGMPIAERFARVQKDDLSPAQVAYCRSVTIAWSVFFVFNGSVTAALALLAPVKLWAVYSGGVSYGLVGLVFAVEYAVRTIRFGTSWAGLVARMKVGRRPRGVSSTGPQVRGFEPRPVEGRPGAFDVHVPANLAYFQGHFDGYPILPGVVQVEVLVARQVATTWPELARVRGVTRLRFKRPIRPGDDLVLQITRPERARVDFDVRCRAEPCSSGTLHFEL